MQQFHHTFWRVFHLEMCLHLRHSYLVSKSIGLDNYAEEALKAGTSLEVKKYISWKVYGEGGFQFFQLNLYPVMNNHSLAYLNSAPQHQRSNCILGWGWCWCFFSCILVPRVQQKSNYLFVFLCYICFWVSDHATCLFWTRYREVFEWLNF